MKSFASTCRVPNGNPFHPFRRVLLTAVPCLTLLVAVILPATAANAADVGWCAPPREMTARLKAEGQRTLAHGNKRNSWVPNNEVGGVFFTADAKGRVGYVIEADKPAGRPASKMCVAMRLHNVKLYDARRPGIPPEALVKGTAQAAERRCAEMVREKIIADGSCGFHNDSLARGAKHGEGVMLQGRRAAKQAGRAYAASAGLITVTFIAPGNGVDENGRRTPARDRTGTIEFTTLPDGASIISSAFIMGSYTEHALKLIKNGTASEPSPPSRRKVMPSGRRPR